MNTLRLRKITTTGKTGWLVSQKDTIGKFQMTIGTHTFVALGDKPRINIICINGCSNYELGGCVNAAPIIYSR